MKSDAMAERIAKRYLTLQGHSQVSAASSDWVSVATEIGAALIPVILECIKNRRSAKGVAEFAQKRPLLARVAVRNALAKDGASLANRRNAANAVMEEIESTSTDDLAESLQELADEA